MVTGVACGLQNRYGAFARPGWVRFPHVPAISLAARCWIAVACGLGVAAPLLGQEEPEAAVARPDSLAVQETTRADTVPPISPLGALARSMVLPGWGQVEVGRPGRGALYFAAEAASLFMVFKSSAKLAAARAAVPEREGLVESRTQQRENWIVLAVFVAFMSGVDAWISTHFWDFEPTLRAPEDGSVGLAVGLEVPVP